MDTLLFVKSYHIKNTVTQQTAVLSETKPDEQIKKGPAKNKFK